MAGDHVLVLGATGPTGQCIVRELLHRGHRVIAYVRNAGKIPSDLKDKSYLEVVQGELTDREALSAALSKTSVIVSALGPVTSGPDAFKIPDTTVFAAFFRGLFPLMQEHGVQRIMLMNTVNTPQPGDQFSIIAWLMRFIAWCFFNRTRLAIWPVDDLLEEWRNRDGIDWMGYRVCALSGEGTDESWRTEREKGGVLAGRLGAPGWHIGIGRARLAKWLVDLVEDQEGFRRYKSQMPAVCDLPLDKGK